MSALRSIAVLAVVAAFALLAAPLWELGGVRPHFLLVAVLTLAALRRAHEAWLAAIVVGAAVDWLSIDPWGVHLASFAAAVAIVRSGVRHGWADRAAARLAFLAVGVVVACAVRAAAMWAIAETASPLAVQIAAAAYTLVVLWPVARLVGAVVGREPAGVT